MSTHSYVSVFAWVYYVRSRIVHLSRHMGCETRIFSFHILHYLHSTNFLILHVKRNPGYVRFPSLLTPVAAELCSDLDPHIPRAEFLVGNKIIKITFSFSEVFSCPPAPLCRSCRNPWTRLVLHLFLLVGSFLIVDVAIWYQRNIQEHLLLPPPQHSSFTKLGKSQDISRQFCRALSWGCVTANKCSTVQTMKNMIF